MAEHQHGGPPDNSENVAHAWRASTTVAEEELCKLFPAVNAKELAEALASATRALVWGDAWLAGGAE